MKTLYIDCFAGFTTEMLLGALIDMGASADYICAELKETGIETVIEQSAQKRGGMDCRLAQLKCTADDETVREILKKNLAAICAFYPQANAAQLCTWAAAMIAAESFGVCSIACSVLSDGHGIDAESGLPVPSPFVMTMLEKCGAALRTMDTEHELISDEGMAYLAASVKNFRLMPSGTILCTGYGAGKTDIDGSAHLLRTVLINADDAEDFLAEFSLNEPFADCIGGLT